MKTEVMKKEDTTLAPAGDLNFADMSREMGISKSDLIIPRVFLTQNGSPFIGEGDSKLGDLFDSVDRKVIGNEAKPLEIIPVTYYKTWNDYEVIRAGTQVEKKFLQQYPCTTHNERQPWSANIDGKEIERVFCINVVAVLKSKIDETVLPHVISFKKTSVQAGRSITNQLAMNLMRSRAPWSSTILLGSTKPPVEKGKSAYATFTVKQGQPVKPEDQAKVFAIYQQLKMLDIAAAAGTDSSDEVAPAGFQSAPAANCGDEMI